MKKVLIFVEIKAGEPRKASMELLCAFASLGAPGRFSVEAVVLGALTDKAKERVLPHVGKLTNITDPALDTYTAEGFSQGLAAYAKEAGADLVVAGATRTGRDFMPRVAILLEAGMASDVTAVNWEKEPLTFVRPIYGGRVLTEVSFTSYPAVITTRPNTFGVGETGSTPGEFAQRQAGIAPDQIRTKVLRVAEKAEVKIDLMEADVIVTGGHGMKTAENFGLLEELASVIGGVVGATRSVVDSKWRDHEDQVGKSGKTVSPKLYIAAGVSGAIHHIMGMDTSKVVLAINKDANAPIFKHADYGIVSDLFDVVPALTKAFKGKLGK